MIEAKDRAAYVGVLSELIGSFVTGSYLVDKESANDIDIVVGESAFRLSTYDFIGSGYDGMKISGVDFGKQENKDEGGDVYGDSENEMFELVEHWRGGAINIIVIKDVFIAAYKAASYALEASPNAHQGREQRVATHQKYKGVIREMLSSEAEDGGDIPW